MNTSATPGYLSPTGGVINQDDLENVLQAMVVGVTGLAPTLVRPRWQPKSPHEPERSETWCAIGVTNFLASATSVQHDGTGDGQDVLTTWTDLELLASFYGPAALQTATRLRDGLMLEQNRAELRGHGLALIGIEPPRNVPELVHGAWLARVDLPLGMQWETRQTYGVLNLTSANGVIVTDTGVTRDI